MLDTFTTFIFSYYYFCLSGRDIILEMEEQIKQELTNGLTSVPMYIPTWYRYDVEGSRLNDMCITNSKWYYFHRHEVNLLKENLQVTVV